MENPGQPCPKCREPTDGNFCSNCGTPLGETRCPSCGTDLPQASRFCHACGAQLTGQARRVAAAIPWAVAGVAIVALILVATGTFRSQAPAGVPVTPPAGGVPSVATTDISNMTPRERADRLFNRIMTTHERGDASEVTFFVPMALQAYALLDGLDPDARYHVGLINAVGGQFAAALAQADSLEQDVPDHLFASLLRASAAQARGDSASLREIRREFLDRHTRERDAGRPEYDEHRKAVDSFLVEARRDRG